MWLLRPKCLFSLSTFYYPTVFAPVNSNSLRGPWNKNKFAKFHQNCVVTLLVLSSTETIDVRQEPLNSYLDRADIEKIPKRHFLGNISNSCHWVTHMSLKPPPKIFFENISTNRAARDFQSFGLIEGAAVLPSKQ